MVDRPRHQTSHLPLSFLWRRLARTDGLDGQAPQTRRPLFGYTLPQLAKSITGAILAALGATVVTTLELIKDGAINAEEIGVLITAWATVVTVAIGVYVKANAGPESSLANRSSLGEP